MLDYEFVNGRGRCILFLHGWGGDKNSFALIKNHIFFSGRNMIFLSFSGFGKSPPPSRPYSVDDYAEESKNLIIKLAKGKSIDIVCHSFGGRVATVLAAKNPELINSIFMIDAAGVKPRRSLKYYIKLHQYKRAKKLVKEGKLSADKLNQFGSADYKALDGVMKQTFVKVVNQDLSDFYKEIKCPVFLFWGKNDTETPLYMAKKMKRQIKNSELFVIDNAGHFSYIEKPDLFFEKLEQFIIKNSDNLL